MAGQSITSIKYWTALCLLLLGLSYPDCVRGEAKHYYYLHISSFRTTNNADNDAERLRAKGYDTIVKGETIADKGFWYRVYIGPFASLKEAKTKRDELMLKKLIDYGAIQKKTTLIKKELPKKPEVFKKKEEVEQEKVVKEVPPKPPMPAEVQVKPIPEIPKEKMEPIVPKEPERVIKPIGPPSQIEVKPPVKKKVYKWEGAGKNMPQGRISLGYRHAYRDIETELTKRKLTTSSESGTTVEDVPLSSIDREDFSSSFHIDSIRLRFGLTNSLEVFADVSGSYKEFSDFGLAYGWGLRLNLFQIMKGGLRGLYGAVQGEYADGELAYEYTAQDGNKWKKETDWNEFSAKAELGLIRSQLGSYVGIVYLNYQEDVERRLMYTLPVSLTSLSFQDEMEQKGFGIYGGVDIRLSSKFFLNIEGQAISQKSIIGALEYHF
jgi:hypothetical protein